MGLLDASSAAGGSQNSATSVSNSYSNTAGAAASAWSAQQAELAHKRQLELLQKTQEYNSAEAEKDRQWQQKNIDIANQMANTVYTRSVKDMINAGINPILAANLGLGAAGNGTVSGGAAASVGTPSTFMGSTYAEQNSASHSESQSQGSSWNNSESGLATFLESMGAWVEGMIGALSSSHTLNIAFSGIEDAVEDYDTSIDKAIENAKKTGNTYKAKVLEQNRKEVGSSKFLKLLNQMQLKATGVQIDK